MKKLLICVPTYNRAQTIQQWIDCERETLLREEVDVLFVDSSENEGTKKVVNDAIDNGFNNLKYVAVDSTIDGNYKALLVYKMAEQYEYEYIWMTHDHTAYLKNSVDYILKTIQETNSDFYVLNIYSSGMKNIRLDSLEDFAEKSVPLLGRYGASIVSRERFLCGVDWEAVEKKWYKADTISWAHVGWWLERASQIDEFKSTLIEVDYKEYVTLTIANQNIDYRRSWFDQTIQVCAGRWYSLIKKLPNTYRNKKQLYKKAYSEWRSKYTYLQCKKEGAYGIKVFWELRKGIWATVNKKDFIIVFLISIMPYFLSRKIVFGNVEKIVKTYRKQGYKIAIYGAGMYAKMCADYLLDTGITFDSFVVTDKKNNEEEIKGHKIFSIDEYIAENEKLYVIVAVHDLNKKTIYEYLAQFDNDKIKYDYFYEM